MHAYLTVLGLAALPAGANVLGGLLAEVVTISRRNLSLAFEWVAGMLLAVVGIELMPRALHASTPWAMILAFVLGGVFFIVLEGGIELVQKRISASNGGAYGGAHGGSKDGTQAAKGPWVIFAGILVDLFITGAMVGGGVTVEERLGLLLALSLLVADAPEGFLTIANLKTQGVAGLTRFMLLIALGLSVLLGATVGYWGLRGQSESLKLALLAFTAGIVLTLVVEEMVPEAQRGGEAEAAALLLLGGFAAVALLSAYVG